MTNEQYQTRMRFLAAQALGRIGGKSRSDRKLAASNANRLKALARLAEMRNEKRAGEQKENNEDRIQH